MVDRLPQRGGEPGRMVVLTNDVEEFTWQLLKGSPLADADGNGTVTIADAHAYVQALVHAD